MNTDPQSPEGGSRPPGSNGNGNGHTNGNPGGDKKAIINWLKQHLLRRSPDQSLKSELEEIIQEHEDEGSAAPEENEIIRNVLKFGDARVTDVMTPRSDICAVQIDITLDDLKKLVVEQEHTRIPVFRENLDDVAGFLHTKDLIPYWVNGNPFSIRDILRDVLFVPPSMKLHILLVKMRAERTHLAIVVDEYGGTDGLVTIEDLVEEIVGEIEDEHDEGSQLEIMKIADNVFEVAARYEVYKLEEELGRKIYSDDESDDFDTVGGLVFTTIGKIPKFGETIKHKSGLTFKVTDVDKRRIKRVKVIVN